MSHIKTDQELLDHLDATKNVSGNVNSHGDVLVGSSLQRLEERRKKRRIRDAQEAMRLGVSEEFRRTILLDYVSGKQG